MTQWVLAITTAAATLLLASASAAGGYHTRMTDNTMQLDEGGGFSLKACKLCMLVKYCNPKSQRKWKHWPKHKKPCKQCAAELHEEDLFKDPPAKEDCPICFLPMPNKLINCFSFPPATISSVLINNVANTHQGLADLTMAIYYSFC